MRGRHKDITPHRIPRIVSRDDRGDADLVTSVLMGCGTLFDVLVTACDVVYTFDRDRNQRAIRRCLGGTRISVFDVRSIDPLRRNISKQSHHVLSSFSEHWKKPGLRYNVNSSSVCLGASRQQ